jgi:hypothetical protein
LIESGEEVKEKKEESGEEKRDLALSSAVRKR